MIGQAEMSFWHKDGNERQMIMKGLIMLLVRASRNMTANLGLVEGRKELVQGLSQQQGIHCFQSASDLQKEYSGHFGICLKE